MEVTTTCAVFVIMFNHGYGQTVFNIMHIIAIDLRQSVKLVNPLSRALAHAAHTFSIAN